MSMLRHTFQNHLLPLRRITPGLALAISLVGLLNVHALPPAIAATATPETTITQTAQSGGTSTGTDASLPAGAVEYNKGVELFQIAQVQSEKGNLSGQKQLLKEAINRFEASLKQNPKLVEAQSNIGFAYLTLHQYNRAIEAFQKALSINPKHLNTLNGLSTAYAFDGKIDDAIKTFNQLTTLDPGNVQYWFNKGSVLQRAGRVEESRVAYEQALKIQPTDQRTLFNLGTLYENQGKLEVAKTYYAKAKGVEIGNTIGLEAIQRIEAIDAALKKQAKPVK
jgi:tetratricopeptide (TPR) repeat protein